MKALFRAGKVGVGRARGKHRRQKKTKGGGVMGKGDEGKRR